MAYLTKPERKARRKQMRILANELDQKIRSMASQLVYSGDAYEHEITEIKKITERIGQVYLGRE